MTVTLNSRYQELFIMVLCSVMFHKILWSTTSTFNTRNILNRFKTSLRRCSVMFLHWCFTHTYRHAARPGRFLIGMQKEFLILRAEGAPCAPSISYFRRRRKSPPTSLIIPQLLFTMVCHRCSTLTASKKYIYYLYLLCSMQDSFESAADTPQCSRECRVNLHSGPDCVHPTPPQ